MRTRWLLFTASFVLLALPALAQRSTATIRGTVTDPSHAVVPGASVTVTNELTGFTRTATTNAAGLYSFADLLVGSYLVHAAMFGFKSAARTNILLNVADDLAVDFELEPGDITLTASVKALVAPVKTIGGDVSGLITGEQARELPLNGRNFMQLATLMPGVTTPDAFNAKDKGILQGNVTIAVSGGGSAANLWTVDGVNNNDVGSNTHYSVTPSVDIIEEFKVLRNGYGPEFGQAGGAQINIVTRAGTNGFHGSAFYSGRNDALDETNYFLKKAGQEKDQLKRHDFGGTFGGPIVRDKLHFFYAQEWNHEDRGSVRTAFVPTQAERTADFSEPPIAGCSPPVPVDPLTGFAFPGNRIPSDRLSQAGLLLLQLNALPNTTPGAGTCNNWVTSLDSPIRWREENIRLDYSVTGSVRLMIRYTHDSSRNNSPSVAGWGDPFPAVDSNWDEPGRSFVAQLNKTIGSASVNSLQFSISGNRIRATRGGVTPDLNDRINVAIPTIFPNEGREYGAASAHSTFWGGQGYSNLVDAAPWHNSQDLFILKEDYARVFGKHLIKAGALGSFNRKNEDIGGGSFENSEFWGSTGLNGSGATTGNIIADILLKDMTFGFDENSAGRQLPERWADLEFYVLQPLCCR
jgi:type 1 fimbria pilin